MYAGLQEAEAKDAARKQLQEVVCQVLDAGQGTSEAISRAAAAAPDSQQGQIAAAARRHLANELEQTSTSGEHSTADQPANSPAAQPGEHATSTPGNKLQEKRPASSGAMNSTATSQAGDAGSPRSLTESPSTDKSLTDDPTPAAVLRQKDASVVGAPGSKQTNDVAALLSVGATAQAASGSTQEDSAGANATAAAEAAADSPQKLPAGNGLAQNDIPVLHQKDISPAGGSCSEQTDKVPGRHWLLEEQLKTLQGQHAAVVSEGDSLQVHVRSLMVQLSNLSTDAKAQQAKLGIEIQQLAGQPSSQLEAQKSAEGEIKRLQEQLKSLGKQHAAVAQERDSLRSELQSSSADADLQVAKLGAENQRLFKLGALKHSLVQAASSDHASLMATVTAMLVADHSAADNTPGGDSNDSHASNTGDMDPAVDPRTDPALLHATEGRAEAAWNNLKDCRAALRVRLCEYQHTGPERHLPLLAAWLLHSQHLSADTAAKCMETAVGEDLLREAGACAGWDDAMRHQHKLKKEVDNLRSYHEDEQLDVDWCWEPVLDVNQIMASPATWTQEAGRLQEILQEQLSMKLQAMRHAHQVNQILRAVEDAFRVQLRDDELGPSSSHPLARWLDDMRQRVEANQEANAFNAAEQEAALCNTIAAYCITMLTAASPVAGTPSQGHVPDPEPS